MVMLRKEPPEEEDGTPELDMIAIQEHTAKVSVKNKLGGGDLG
jgi:hypothetical protein